MDRDGPADAALSARESEEKVCFKAISPLPRSDFA